MLRWILAFVFVVAVAANADEKPNCKLVTHTKFKSGKKTLDVDEIRTPSWLACKEEAVSRELTTDDEIAVIKVVYGYRGE